MTAYFIALERDEKQMNVLIESAIALVLILANGLLAMSEMAVVAARKTRLQQRAEEGSEAAAQALKLTNNPGDFLSSVQIGITLVGILIGAFGTASLSRVLSQWLQGVTAVARYADVIAAVVVVALLTYLTLVLGELAPKQIALNQAERISMSIAKPMTQFARWTRPLVALLSGSSTLVLRILRLQTADEPHVSEEDVRILLDQGAQSGIFEPEEGEIVSQVFRLSDLQVGDLITPRTDILWVDHSASEDEIREQLVASGRSRLPVADGSLDHVVGVVLAKDVLSQCMSGQPINVDSVMAQPLFVPENMPALALVEHLKATHSKMALVIDEYGGLEGLVTVDDVMEALVGDIPQPEEPNSPDMVQREDGSWLVDGLVLLEDLEETLQLSELPIITERYRTVSGLVMALLGRLPETGDVTRWEGYRIEVVDMDGRRVDKVLVTSEQQPA